MNAPTESASGTSSPQPPVSSTAPTPATVSPTHRVGDYDLLYRLGTGGMGNVYLARRRNESGLQRLFAVKAMHPMLSADSEFANMFLDEAYIASQLHHTNVVGIVDLGRYGERLYLVMDYVEGPTLAQLLRASAERPPAIISSVVIDVLHGLQAAHSLTNDAGERLDLVHRDVSPSNILVATDGVARLTDFGIAKARLRRTSTMPGVRKGKLSYSAPEQITSPGYEDARVDVFAAGVVLWNALTGSRLFDGQNEASVLLSVISRPIPPPSQVGLRPPACFDAVCLRALSRDRAGRYSTAAEMADDLRRVTRANDLVVGPEQVGAWVSKFFGEELKRRRHVIRSTASPRRRSRGTGADSLVIGTPGSGADADGDGTPLLTGTTGLDGATPRMRQRRLPRSIILIGLAALSIVVMVAVAISAFSRYRRDPPGQSAGTPASPPEQGDGARVIVNDPAPNPAPVPATLVDTTPTQQLAPAPAIPTAEPTPPADKVAAPVAANGDDEEAVDESEARESETESSKRQAAARSQRRRRPPAPVRSGGAAERSEEEPEAAEPPAPTRAAPAPAPTRVAPEPPKPAAPERIESNPYFRRGAPKSR